MFKSLEILIAGQAEEFKLEIRIFNVVTLVWGTLVALSVIPNLLIGLPIWLNALAVFYGIFCCILFYFSRVRRQFRLLPQIFFVVTLLVGSLMWFFNGGLRGSLPIALLSLIFLFVVIIDNVRPIWIVALVIADVTLVSLLEYFYPAWVVSYSNTNAEFFDAFVAILLVTPGIGLMASIMVKNYKLERSRAEREQEKSERLLRNILPDEVALLLKQGQHTIADHFEEASILFADIVDFTPMSANMTPRDLVHLLDEVFSDFDALTEKYDLEKIKTIGDCYMVVAGLPRLRQNHAVVLARMAVEMRAHAARQRYRDRQINLRIGIHSGAVVAGVVGTKKFSYDLWGDTVNTASRMESHGSRNAIQITRATYELIKDDFVCESCGWVNVKGKGEMEVWHVMAEKVNQERG